MSFRINTNFAAMGTHASLSINDQILKTSMERLSSGLRINHASDDPTGLVQSENFRAQIGGLEAATRNNQDAVNFSKTAEAGLGEVNSLLDDARALIIASGNSATLSSTQIQANQDQISNIIASITRISQSVQFGSKRLLDGSSGIQAQVSAGAEVQSISLVGTWSGAPITAQALMTLTNMVQVGQPALLSSSTLPGGTILNPGSFGINGTTFSFLAGATGAQVATSVNAASASTGVVATWNTGTNQLDFSTVGIGQGSVMSFSDASGVISAGPPVTVVGTNPVARISMGTMGTVLFTGGRSGTDGYTLFDADGNSVRLTSAGNLSGAYPMTIGQVTPGAAVFQYGGNAGQTAQLSLPNMGASQLGADVVANMSVATIDITSASHVNDALTVIDRAIAQVSATRGQIGSFTSYVLESNTRTLQQAKQNMTASESAIRDVDVAAEMTTYTTAQVLQQSGMAMLAQANSMPQNILSLLKG